MSDRLSPVLDHHGSPIVHRNGKPRPQLIEAMLANQPPRRAQLSYDGARHTQEFQRHWANSDSLDADSANSREVRHTLMRRSRYEAGSNGYYDGTLSTHANMVVGIGPTLRMLSGNRQFNQLVERDFYRWTQQVQLRRKLWCMDHALNQDGEGMGMLLTNPALPEVQLDLLLIEAEQCQTPFMPFIERGYIDGIRFDEFNNVIWYDVLPTHPGSANQFTLQQKAIPVPASEMLHWFRLKRPGSHRGIPAMTSTLNLGASSRRWREATLAAAESAADFNVLLKTTLNSENIDPVSPMSTLQVEKRMMTALPQGWDAYQMRAEFPTATHGDYSRTHISEQSRPMSMPYNAAACDSSTYSFASGKLDTLCYRAAIDVERQDCNELVLDRIFQAWFREWVILADRRRDFAAIPDHQWDWPVHPVIDAVAESQATDTKLKNGTATLRQVFSDAGRDIEDELSVMAEDWFGEVTDENVKKARQILLLKNTPEHAIEYVAAIAGVSLPEPEPAEPTSPPATAPQEAA